MYNSYQRSIQMLMVTYTLKNEDDFIELVKLLKTLKMAESGGHGKMMIAEGQVKLNGNQEFRKRAKIRRGDLIETPDGSIQVI